MRSIALGLTGVLLFCGTAFAQPLSALERTLHIGIKGAGQIIGIANQNNYGQNEMRYNLPFGLAAGISAQYSLTERGALLAEVNYQEQGQFYSDVFRAMKFVKLVEMQYITAPIAYKHYIGDLNIGYSGIGNIGAPQWYVMGGLQFGYLLDSDITWEINNQPVDFFSFVTQGGNANTDDILESGIPEDDKAFYRTFDLVFIAAGGFHMSLSEALVLSTEVRGGIGLTDINAEEWRLPNREGKYGASRTTFLGLHVGLAIQLF